MKKYLALLLMMSLVAAPCALAEEAATPLPYGVTFEMDGPTVAQTVGNDAVFEPLDPEYDDATGTVCLFGGDISLGGIEANYINFDITRNNSAEVPRLYMISAALPTEGNGIADFRAALAALTAVYGEPDSDPFDEGGVASYTEYGGLDATWSRTDVRINLSMQRMYGPTLTLSFFNRLCYDAADLEE